jgi:outer membrane cobalamin receptor
MAQIPNKKRIRVSGYIYDLKSKETLIGATFYDVKSKTGTTTNNYGFYSTSISEGKTDILISYMGYEKQIIQYTFTKDTSINIYLKPFSTTLQEVVIEDKSIARRFVDDPTPGKIVINPLTITSLPSLTGESDLLKSLQLLPGVKSGTEGTTGLYVRGGNSDQNLYLVDGIPIYNPNHLMGFISTFNTDAIKNIEFYKGAFPARYGGRLSSVVDVRMKDGNNEKIQGEASIGLISAKLNVEGPIIKDKTTFSISGRRTYLDILTKPIIAYENSINDENLDFGYYFGDLNIKLNHKFSPSNRLTASLYWGEDKYTFGMETNNNNLKEKNTAYVKWGSLIGTVDWAYEINNRLFSNLSFSYNRYRSTINSTYESTYTENGSTNNSNLKFDYISGVEDWSVKNDYNFYLNGWNSINYGINYIYHTYSPELISASASQQEDISGLLNNNSNVYGNEVIVYVEDEMNFTDKFCVSPGIHYNMFNVGSKTYHSFQPRLGIRYSLLKNLSFKAGYAMMNQNIHLLANGIISLPTDLWVPVTENISPITSHQISGGLFYQLKDWANISCEGYYKKLNNIIDYKDGISSFNTSENWEEKVAQGIGEAYGMEFLVQRDKGSTTGWISYTLSWAFREFPNGEINGGKRYYDRYDSRHQINIVVTHKFSEKIDVTAAWVYNSGNRMSVPVASYYNNVGNSDAYSSSELIEVYGERNNYKMPDYHRLDLSINFNKKKKHGTRIWSINIYNVYNRKNAFFVVSGNAPNKLTAYSIMPIIPTISYTYKFR